MIEPSDVNDGARLDKWLWAVRVFKTRPLATAACRDGEVTVNSRDAKPARNLHPGEIVTVRQGIVTRTLIFLANPPGRIGARRVVEFCEDRTSPEEWAKAREWRVQQISSRASGAGRPTKRERRLRDRLFE